MRNKSYQSLLASNDNHYIISRGFYGSRTWKGLSWWFRLGLSHEVAVRQWLAQVKADQASLSPYGLSSRAGLRFLTSWRPQDSGTPYRAAEVFSACVPANTADVASLFQPGLESHRKLRVTNSPRIKENSHLFFEGWAGVLLVEPPVFDNYC